MLNMSIEKERRLAEVLEDEAVFVSPSLIPRVDFIIAAFTAERAVDFDFGAAWYKELQSIILLLELTKGKMNEYLERKEQIRKQTEEFLKEEEERQ